MFTDNPYEAFHFADWWDTLSTSFVSFYFIVFVFVLAFLYYLMPKKARWSILLIGSVAFYSIAGVHSLIIVVLSSLIAYSGGIIIGLTERENKRKRKFWLFSTVVVLLGMLAFVKCYSLFAWEFKYVIPLGISYYTFSAIGYLADIYWGKDQAERNFFKLALFLLFFPKILQGPIARHKTLAPQLNKGQAFDYTKFCYGIQLAIWGYFKKLVVADRIGIVTGTVFGNYKAYGGGILFLTMLLAAFQLYCDFSGCMDIAGGVAQMFGIELEKNFNHPFFARSAAEFWQRWHMTLSGWFKDYIFLPVSRSEWVKKFSRFMGNKFSATARKNSIVLIASFFVWIATGVWHGTGWSYVVWGIYWYIIINSSILLATPYSKLRKIFRVNEEGTMWKLFQMVRTYLLFGFGRIITIPGDLSVTNEIVSKIFTKFQIWQLFDGTLYSLGLTIKEFQVLTVGIVAVWIVEYLQTKMSLREQIAQWNILIRCAFYSVSIVIVLVFGLYGLGYGNTTFSYMNF